MAIYKFGEGLEVAKFTRPELLLHPNIPKPLHGLNPRTLLGQKWWDKKRQEAYAKNNYCCWACGVHKSQAEFHQWLEGHERYEIDYETGVVELVEIVALCHSCHNYIHNGRMEMLVKQRDMTPDKMGAIIDHGEAVLTDAGFDQLKPIYPNLVASWDEWHLLIDGEEFYSKFNDAKAWYNHYVKKEGQMNNADIDGKEVMKRLRRNK